MIRRVERQSSWLVLAVALAGFCTSAVVGDRRSDDASLFSRQAYVDHVSYLASDELEGRGTGQEGIDKAAKFIAEYFEKCGVQPAGDDGTYFQNFTLKLWNRIGKGTRLKFGVEGKPPRRSAKLEQDYVPFPFSASARFKGEVAFVGYGIVSEDEDYNDYADIDVTDKVVLMLRRAPRFTEFGIRDISFRAKASKANARDAAAILVVNPSFDEEGDELFDFEGSGGGGFGMSPRSFGLPMIHIRRELAEQLLKAGGLPDLAMIEKRIDETEKPMSAILTGVTVKGRVDLEPVESPVRNVVGLIPGTGPKKDEYIVLGAHYDHLGIRNKGEAGFDPEKDISNGADDNASGTALIMTMADAYTRGRAPNRSLLLALFTGEERGLLGSQHFANHPTIELSKAVAMLNFDMVGRLRKSTLEVGGMGTGDFEELVQRAAASHGLKVKDGGGGRGPSDHTSFYNKDIPVLFFFTGLHKEYHRPEDDTPLLNFDGAIQIARFVADVVDEIDASEEAPQFAKDNRRPRIGRPDDEEEDKPQIAAAAPGERETVASRDWSGSRGAEGQRVRLGIRPDSSAGGEGVVIAEVFEDTPAALAGLKGEDRVVHLAGKKVSGVEELVEILGGLRLGDKSTVVVLRGGKEVSREIQFGDAVAAVALGKDSEASIGSDDAGKDTVSDAVLSEEIERARVMYEACQRELDTLRQDRELLGRSLLESRKRLETLNAIETERALEMDSKRILLEKLEMVSPKDPPITPDLQAALASDPKVQELEDRLDAAEERVVEMTARHGNKADVPDVVAARAVRDFAENRLNAERSQRLMRYQMDQIDRAKKSYLETQSLLLSIRERLAAARAEIQDIQQRDDALRDIQAKCDQLKRRFLSLTQEQQLIKSAPRIARIAQSMRKALAEEADVFDMSIKFDLENPGTAFEILIRPKGGRGGAVSKRSDEEERAITLAQRESRSETKLGEPSGDSSGRRAGKSTANKKPTKSPKVKADDPHAGMGDDVTATPMPPVRLGIMPNYGETAGEGYEITGVVEGGPAAKAGMMDEDRIYKIGDSIVTDIYSYMEALGKFKPGDTIKVTVLRKGEKIELKVKVEGPQRKEAA